MRPKLPSAIRDRMSLRANSDQYAANSALFDHLVGAAESRGGTVKTRRTPGSLRLYACKLDHLGPFIDFPRDHASELGGRASSRRVTNVNQSRLQFRIGQAGIDLSVELFNDLGGYILGETDPIPAVRLVARHGLGDGRDVR